MLCKDGSRELWNVMDSSSNGMMWGDWCVGSVVIVYVQPEGVAIVLELGASGYM